MVLESLGEEEKSGGVGTDRSGLKLFTVAGGVSFEGKREWLAAKEI